MSQIKTEIGLSQRNYGLLYNNDLLQCHLIAFDISTLLINEAVTQIDR